VIALHRSLWLDANAWAERVTTADLLPGSTRHNGGVVATLRFAPDF
jgi:hypothetical protein